MGGKRKWNKGHRAAPINWGENEFDEIIQNEVDQLFLKKFTYNNTRDDQWALPKCESFHSDAWHDPQLMHLKVSTSHNLLIKIYWNQSPVGKGTVQGASFCSP